MRAYNRYKDHRLMDERVGKYAKVLSYSLKKRVLPSKIRTITIVKLGSLGDSLLCLPMIRLLKQKTNAEITVIHSSENKDVFFGHKFIDKTIHLKVSQRKWSNLLFHAVSRIWHRSDVAFDLSFSGNSSAILTHYTSRFSIGFSNSARPQRDKWFDTAVKVIPSRHVVMTYFDLASSLGIIPEEKDLSLIPMICSKKERLEVDKWLSGKEKLVGIHSFHEVDYKAWPLHNFLAVMKYLIDRGFTVCLIGSKKESLGRMHEIHKKFSKDGSIIDLCGKTSISQASYVLSKCSFVVAHDGGIMHIAAANNVPTLGLFGVESPLRYAPFNQKSFSLYTGNPLNPPIKAYALQWPSNTNKDFFVLSAKEVIMTIKERFLKHS